MNRFLPAMLGALSLVALACSPGSSPAAPADDPELVVGQEVYARECARCHRADGGGGVGPRISDGRSVEEFPDIADQRELIVTGRKSMPPFGPRLTDDQIDAVIRYTREVL